jgi:hypothetical protein
MFNPSLASLRNHSMQPLTHRRTIEIDALLERTNHSTPPLTNDTRLLKIAARSSTVHSESELRCFQVPCGAT